MQKLLGGERRGGAVGDGEGGVRLQDAALPQEVQQVAVGSVFYRQVEVAYRRNSTEQQVQTKSSD